MTAPRQAPTLQSIVPPGAVPSRLRAAAVRLLNEWGYGWGDVTFAGTATLPSGGLWQLTPGGDEIWVLAVTAAPLVIGAELESAGGRARDLQVSAFSGGVIPVTPHHARVYEFLGRRGGGREAPEHPEPPGLATTPDMEPAAPDQQG